jgi:dTDP-4-dehydrorhamnose 3,5-epimerase
MNVIGTKLKDVYLIKTETFHDRRGFFTESFNLRNFQKNIGNYEFVQDCHSFSVKDVVRGLHYQIENPQGKIVRCLSGRIYDVIVDLRKNSPTFGEWSGFNLYPGSSYLWVPPGFAHGFKSLTDGVQVFYKVTDYQYKEHERTLMWNDPDLSIDWGNDFNSIMSEKDMKGISFKECEKYD